MEGKKKDRHIQDGYLGLVHAVLFITTKLISFFILQLTKVVNVLIWF